MPFRNNAWVIGNHRKARAAALVSDFGGKKNNQTNAVVSNKRGKFGHSFWQLPVEEFVISGYEEVSPHPPRYQYLPHGYLRGISWIGTNPWGSCCSGQLPWLLDVHHGQSRWSSPEHSQVLSRDFSSLSSRLPSSSQAAQGEVLPSQVAALRSQASAWCCRSWTMYRSRCRSSEVQPMSVSMLRRYVYETRSRLM